MTAEDFAQCWEDGSVSDLYVSVGFAGEESIRVAANRGPDPDLIHIHLDQLSLTVRRFTAERLRDALTETLAPSTRGPACPWCGRTMTLVAAHDPLGAYAAPVGHTAHRGPTGEIVFDRCPEREVGGA